ncbi:pilus motility taxis protein HmpF [Leptolyngbya sp. PCC 6406]|uniref:pilus motility taxis protein HmpF n=1 Tax=Leptolyngbya sp. PCC 6406 TaxID=1173264 RepID=UPI0002ABD16F|nr:pilus motility taxis protein HmpF [Leptolyngbya sp. PCC 6406]
MLYLAEVQKKSGVFGSGKAEFKLLTCQRGETWTTVPGDEVVAAPDDATYNAGALVMLEMGGNRQIQRHYDAGRPLVGILQNFSSQSKKFKAQEEEIEQWKQSLTFQSQALNQRELELETRQEQVEQAESDAEQIDAQRQELEASQAEMETLKQELERKTQELEGAWAHLNGEIRRFEERQADVQQQAGLDESQMQQIQDALDRLMGAVAPTEEVREQFNLTYEAVDQQNGTLTTQEQTLADQQAALADKQAQIQQEQEAIQARWQTWQEGEATLGETKANLKFQRQLLSVKQDRVQRLSLHLQTQSSLYQQVYELLNTSDKVRLSNKVDVAALEAMALDALKSTVSELEKDLEKVSRFVSDQEEELNFELEAIDELKQKIAQASEYDRLQLETELVDEQDRYQMLNETLVGQRRNLLEREEILSQHQAVLRRRQGITADETPASAVDLEPVMAQIDTLRGQTSEDIKALETEIKAIQATIEQLKQEVEQQTGTQAAARTEILALEAELQTKRDEVAALGGRAVLLEELVVPVKEGIATLRQKLDETAASIAKFQEASDYQLQAIAEMRQIITSFSGDVSQATAAS